MEIASTLRNVTYTSGFKWTINNFCPTADKGSFVIRSEKVDFQQAISSWHVELSPVQFNTVETSITLKCFIVNEGDDKSARYKFGVRFSNGFVLETPYHSYFAKRATEHLELNLSTMITEIEPFVIKLELFMDTVEHDFFMVKEPRLETPFSSLMDMRELTDRESSAISSVGRVRPNFEDCLVVDDSFKQNKDDTDEEVIIESVSDDADIIIESVDITFNPNASKLNQNICNTTAENPINDTEIMTESEDENLEDEAVGGCNDMDYLDYIKAIEDELNEVRKYEDAKKSVGKAKKPKRNIYAFSKCEPFEYESSEDEIIKDDITEENIIEDEDKSKQEPAPAPERIPEHISVTEDEDKSDENSTEEEESSTSEDESCEEQNEKSDIEQEENCQQLVVQKPEFEAPVLVNLNDSDFDSEDEFPGRIENSYVRLAKRISKIYLFKMKQIADISARFLISSSRFNLGDLFIECSKCFAAQLTVENFSEVWDIAKELKAEALMQLVVEFVIANRKKIVFHENMPSDLMLAVVRNAY